MEVSADRDIEVVAREEVVMVERVFLNRENINVIVSELLEQHGKFVGSDKFA